LHGGDRLSAIRQAIDDMKLVGAVQDAVAKDWFRLAQLQGLVDDRAGRLESLSEATRHDGENTYYLVAFFDELLVQGKLQEAESVVAKLGRAANDFAAAAAVARYFCLSNQPSEALLTMERYAQSADGGTSDGLDRLRRSVAALDQLARLTTERKLPCAKILTDSALEKYRSIVRNIPETAIPMAGLLAYANRGQEALDLLHRQKSTLSSKALSSAALGVLRSGNCSPRQVQLVKIWLDEALQASPKSVAIRLNLAELQTIRHDHAAAQQIYREILKIEPDNVHALNNLAWMLSARPDSASEALKYVNRAIELMGPNGELLDTRARIFIATEDYQRAIDDLRQALNQAPTPLRYFHLAVAQFKMSKMDDALKSFKEAQAHGLDQNSIHPDDMPTYKVLTQQSGD
jgi:cellulose synthase operon protein C